MTNGRSRRYRVLVLSGGGGRGAFHAGVYKYLSRLNKTAVDDEHKGAWVPDVIVGTSIGAVNGAAITQGISAEELERAWLELNENNVEGLPPRMSLMMRFAMGSALRGVLKNRLKKVGRNDSHAEPLEAGLEYVSPRMPLLPRWFWRWLLGRWSNLLDTAPLYDTLQNTLKINTRKLTESEKILLISATHIRTGEAVFFTNKQDVADNARRVMAAPITPDRIVASCSIPLVYPATEVEGELYWDGAVVTNTPLGPAFDAIRGDADEVEVVVVMMTPWHSRTTSGLKMDDLPKMGQPVPKNIAEMLTYALDWALLGSFRAELELMDAYNKLVKMAKDNNIPTTFLPASAVVVAPDNLNIIQSIIDYGDTARALIDAGERAAEAAFQKAFSPQVNRTGPTITY